MTVNNEFTIVGIDGGGTHTRGVLYRGGKTLSDAKAGTTRVGAVGVGESCERVLNVIIELVNRAGIEFSELDAVIVGLAGVWLDEEKKRSVRLLRTLARGADLQFNDLMVTSDAELALEGAFEGNPGIITIMGTGSIAIGNPEKNKIIRCGGWGIELDDEGSGAWIGREGLTAVVRAIDGRGKPTILTELIADLFPSIDLDRPRTIVSAYAERAFEYHMLSPHVMKCAQEGDEVCLNIIERAANHLVELPLALQKQFNQDSVNVALMGGIIDSNTLLGSMVKERVTNSKSLNLTEPKGTALDGALRIGTKLVESGLDN